MNTLELTRGGEKYILNWQITPDGRFQFYATQEATMNGQPVKIPIRLLNINFDEDGWLTGINTSYKKYALDNEGKAIDPNNHTGRYTADLPMTSNAADLRGFVLGFAGPLFPSIANGLVRSGLGFNYYPPFNSATGQVLTYTQEQEQQPPSNDYYTHHSDGTPINPLIEDNEAN